MASILGAVEILHKSESGVRERSLGRNPRSFAREVSRYISCPTTVRARTLDEFGKAPTIAEIATMRAKHLAEREAFRRAVEGCEEPPPPEPARPQPVTPRPIARIALWPKWYGPPPLRRRLLGADLVKFVGQDFGLTVEEIRGASRATPLVEARSVIAKILKGRGLSYSQIARQLGRKDHSTAIHSLDRFDVYAKRNPRVQEVYDRHLAMEALG